MYDVIFVDMDNTIAENTTCQDVHFFAGMYLNKRPISFVIDAIDSLLRNKSKKVVVVTVFQGAEIGKSEKLQWLQNVHFQYDDVLFVDEHKTKKYIEMTKYCSQYQYNPSHCLFIDDKKIMLQDAAGHGFQVIYPQQLLVDYYEWLSKQKF
jgi:FMN phosphatase YigB (HAD superfamily)